MPVPVPRCGSYQGLTAIPMPECRYGGPSRPNPGAPVTFTCATRRAHYHRSRLPGALRTPSLIAKTLRNPKSNALRLARHPRIHQSRGSFLHQPGRGGYVRVSLVSFNPCVGGTTARELSSSGARHCRRTVLMVAGSYGTDKEHDGYRRGIACSVEGETVDNPKDLRLLLNWSKCTTS